MILIFLAIFLMLTYTTVKLNLRELDNPRVFGRWVDMVGLMAAGYWLALLINFISNADI